MEECGKRETKIIYLARLQNKTAAMVKLFIGNLSPSTTADQLRTLFAQYGKVTESDVVKDFGFVHMDEQAAQEAIRNLHHYELNGRLMNVEVSRSKKQQQHPDPAPPSATTKLHVGNISSTCTSQELRAKFEAYGPVAECDIVKEYAFVHMERAEDAMEAIQGLDNAAFQGKLISVKLSTSNHRTTPGMGDRMNCFVCGRKGHWAQDCRMAQNNSYSDGPAFPKSNGFHDPGFRGRGDMGFRRGGPGGPGFGRGAGFGPGPAYGRGSGYGGGPESSRVPGYGVAPDSIRVAGYGGGPESSGYRGGPGFGRGLHRGRGAGYSGAEGYGGVQMYSGEAGYSSGSLGYPAKRPSPYGERESYSGVDFYEQFRSRPLEERHSLAPPHLPPPPPPSSMMRDRLSASALNPYERRPMPAPVSSSSYYARERSPVCRAPPVAEGYGYERSRLSPVSSSLSRSSPYEAPRVRDPYAERARYAF
ncbi:RNA-binding protein 4.1-like isoform X1 [Huso huso]|uniref:RNA-binding protein 4.1-like isoform X1 n=1 Tax=Huso huso TaxID=61971 RepID=A0ABR0YZV1_HUSHU